MQVLRHSGLQLIVFILLAVNFEFLALFYASGSVKARTASVPQTGAEEAKKGKTDGVKCVIIK